MVLAQKQKYTPTEQDRELRDKPTHLWVPYLTKEGRIYDWAKIGSSISGAGKTGQYTQKNEVRTLPNAITKINSKWVKDLNVRKYKILRGKYRQNT